MTEPYEYASAVPRRENSSPSPDVKQILAPGHNWPQRPLSDSAVMSRAVLLDVSGRRVLDLHPDANDVQTLAPGAYCVREAQAQAQTVRKVIKLR